MKIQAMADYYSVNSDYNGIYDNYYFYRWY